ncbi:hypothetical protein [Rhizobium viscosum]|uniref:Transcriptional regulator n=1 Tax=Rhizobium viscosum TaxID=1673 RepID=A0ABR9IZ00_RHIVS|nr:hypothetical protein [Rhizobium viscosum]MBE1508298.1 hypothetical protein [Rhizobium viscosum]
MSLLNLLSLQDDEIDIATTVVHEWCSLHQTPIDSDRGHAAMAEVVRLLLSGEKSPVLISDALAHHVRLDQFKSPTD